jgi:hypothetical protein
LYTPIRCDDDGGGDDDSSDDDDDDDDDDDCGNGDVMMRIKERTTATATQPNLRCKPRNPAKSRR